MNVLVSGGAGYIGSVLVRQLIERGHEVTVLDRFFFGREPLDGVKCKIIRDDIRAWKDEWLDGIDAVAHLAGLSNDPTSEYNPEANWQMNAVASEVIAAACKRRGVERITFASSASVYDCYKGEQWLDGGEPPLMCHEALEIMPRGAYSTSKAHAEKAMLEVGATVLRQGTVYGCSPRMRFDLVVNTFVRDVLLGRTLTLHGGGMMWRPLVDVEDVARAHVVCLEAPLEKVRGEVFNVVWDNVQVKDIALATCAIAYRDLKRVPQVKKTDEMPKIVRNYRVSGEKMKDRLDFVYWNPLNDGITHFIKRYVKGDVPWSCAEDMMHPRHYNIAWMGLLEQVHREQSGFSGIYDLKGSVAA